MTLKLDRDQLAAELGTLDHLLATLPTNDFAGRIGLESRRTRIREQLEALSTHEERKAKIALYFGGDPVIGSLGVEANFGTNAIGSFQDLISKVWSVQIAGDLQSMGPVSHREASRLHITNLVHGSFGFLLEELDDQGEPFFQSQLSKAADQVADYVASFASENEAIFAQAIEDLNPRVFQSIKDFFGFMHKGQATFRMVEGERDVKFDRYAVERAWSRAEASKVDEEHIQVEGRLLGVIPMRRRFEFEPDGESHIIEGKVDEKFGQTYLEKINTEQFSGRRWKALLHKRIVVRVGRLPTERYTLLELVEITT